MKYLIYLLIFTIFSLITSSCGVLWDIYQAQLNYLAPHHSLESNPDYEVLWNLSDINVVGSLHTPMMIGSPNKIIVMGRRKGIVADSTIRGVNSENGNTLWEVHGTFGDIIASDDSVYVGTHGTVTVHSLDIENGYLLWHTYLPSAHSTSDINFAQKKIFVHTNDSEFYILNDKGEVLDDFRETFRTFLELNGILYMEDVLGIQAIELSSKREVWKLRIGERYTYAPIFDDGEIFLRTRNIPSSICSIDQYTGIINWIVVQDAISNLCLAGDRIYFTSSDGYLVAINRYSSFEVSRVKFSPQFDLDKQIGDYLIACDRKNGILAVSFGDNTQIMGLRILNP